MTGPSEPAESAKALRYNRRVTTASRYVGALLALAGALVVLNASVSFENVWPTPKVQWAPALSVELAACVLLLAVAPQWATRLARRALPALWVALVAGHYLDVTAPGLYGRDFNLYWDSRHLANVVGMLATAAPLWQVGLTVCLAAATIGVVYVLARLALTRVAWALGGRHTRIGLGAVATTILLAFAVQESGAVARTGLAFADPVIPAYVRQARFALAVAGGPAAPTLAPSPALDSDLLALDGADVLIIFVESYGAVTFDIPAIADGLATSRGELEASLRDTGRRAVSAYVDSPTFGASSWLAHLSLLSGVEIRDQYAYTSLMASRRDTLLTTFERQGYRSVALMPGMRQPWPEGAFYGFDATYGRRQLEYDGPQFGWWSIPDQYALAKLDALERPGRPRPPVVVFFPTSTTHAPFGPVAPYQPDWTKVLTPEAFDAMAVEQAMAARPDLTNLRPSYVRAMAYEFASFAGYLRANQHGNLLVILVGDHQPPAAVTGTDAAWLVPVHVIGKSGPVLRRLVERGFRPGLTPEHPSIGAMHTLAPSFLDAFGTPDSQAPTDDLSQQAQR